MRNIMKKIKIQSGAIDEKWYNWTSEEVQKLETVLDIVFKKQKIEEKNEKNREVVRRK